MVHRTARQHRQSPATGQYQKQEAKNSKNNQAKKTRGHNKDAVCTMEDILRMYFGWQRKEQNRGNGNGAGLSALKIHILLVFTAICLWLIHEKFIHSIRTGTLSQFRAKAHQVAEAAIMGVSSEDHFLKLDPGEVPCRTEDSKSKECIVHGTPDWVSCRQKHTTDRFERNFSKHKYDMKRGVLSGSFA